MEVNGNSIFKSKKLNIDEVTETDIPRLLDDETIQRLKEKSAGRSKWEHKSQKHQYLLSRLLYDEKTGFTLTGQGNRYYQAYRGSNSDKPPLVRRDLIENAVCEVLFEALSNREVFHEAAEEVQKEIEKLTGKRKKVHLKGLYL